VPNVNVLRFASVRFAYAERPVLEGITLDVEAGETVALLGRNGAGKTTFTKLAVALLHPDAGEIRVAGEVTAGRAPEDVAHLVAYVFQHPDQQLFARTAVEEAAFGPQRAGLDTALVRAIAEEALARVGLAGQCQAHPYDLTPAQRKLLTLAAALAQRPQLLILDEPTHGFDRAATARVTRIVREVAEAGIAVLLVSHDLEFVAETVERAVVLAEGGIAADEPLQRLLTRPRRVEDLGLVAPPAVRVSLGLGLPEAPVRAASVAAAIGRLRASGG